MHKDIPILLVEDDFIDAKNIERAFKRIKIDNELVFATNGRIALERLESKATPRDPSGEDSLPGIILLDLNMPIMDGVEFLRAIKSDDRFRDIPVVVLTSSSDLTDLDSCYHLGAAGYIVKPIIFEDIVECLKKFDDYWSICELPRSTRLRPPR